MPTTCFRSFYSLSLIRAKVAFMTGPDGKEPLISHTENFILRIILLIFAFSYKSYAAHTDG